MAKKKPDLTFEAALLRLDEIIAALDAGDVALDASLELFEQGASLLRYCNEALAKAQLKIEEIMPEDARE